MIAFPCGQCGKRFERPESTAGTLVWCACGARNVVPWESTLPELPKPLLDPDRTDERRIPPASAPAQWPDWDRPRQAVRQRNPSYCFNHQETPVQHTCPECGEKFCADCVVAVQGRTLCGPCKNYHLRQLQKPPRVSVLAILAPLTALVIGPGAMFFLTALVGSAGQRGDPGSVAGTFMVVAVFGVAFQAAALVMGGLALRAVESNPRLGGRALAITGLVASAVGIILITEFAVILRHQVE